ncbi:MAG: type I-E CRISPR-associated protein Cse1/CasA [Gammaproteobacteria bacterium]|nr:type I-E CRISPR-associated protein Cse1/CasA [Gammaproteobacteria bacterium]
MNLLTDKWIPIRLGGQFSQITLQQLLTTDTDYHLALPRDDMELGALQLLISLVQAIAPPDDAEQLRQRAKTPLTESHYQKITEGWLDKFDLLHDRQPFMQVTDPKAKEATPIQKLFIGLPEGNNHAFFNEPGEISHICESCSAIALFNQASNAPGFSGKHKAGLRGGGKINTFAVGESLRETIWLNVLSQQVVNQVLPEAMANDFCWISPIHSGQKIPADLIGINRGLFWQPLRLRLSSYEQSAVCDHCGHTTEKIVDRFLCEADFKFEVVGQWSHPHSPRQWDIKKGSKEKERYLSLNQLIPGWTQLNQFVLNQSTDKQGSARAPVIDQFEQVFLDRTHNKLVLYVAGYANKQAAILERRHELFAMPEQWHENKKWLERAIDLALETKQILRGRLYYFGKETGAHVHTQAERQYYQQTESNIHRFLQNFSHRIEARQALQEFIDQCKSLARQIFEELTVPYQYSPAGLAQYAKSRSSLEAGLRNISI